MYIPDQAPDHDIGSGRATNVEFLPLPAGGVHDTLGESDADMSNRRFTVRCAVTKNFLNSTNGATMDAAFAKMMGYAGKRGTLYRTQDQTPATDDEHATCRLMEVKARRTPGDTWMIPVELDFMMIDRVWKGDAASVVRPGFGENLINGSAYIFNATNFGDAIVTDATFTITANDTSNSDYDIRTIKLRKLVGAVAYGDLNYNATVSGGNVLVIDCGARSVKNNGVDDYANFTLGTGQRSDGWIRLGPGNNTLELTVTCANTAGATLARITAEYNAGWR